MSLKQTILDFLDQPDADRFEKLAAECAKRERAAFSHHKLPELDGEAEADSLPARIPAIEPELALNLAREADASQPLWPLALSKALAAVTPPAAERLRLVLEASPNDPSGEAVARVARRLAATAADESFLTKGSERLDAKTLRSWLGARQRDRRPVEVAASVDRLSSLIELLERRGLKFRLPAGSVLWRLAPLGSELKPVSLGGFAERLGLGASSVFDLLCRSVPATPWVQPAGQDRIHLPAWMRAYQRPDGRLSILDLTSVPVHTIERVSGQVQDDGRLVLVDSGSRV